MNKKLSTRYLDETIENGKSALIAGLTSDIKEQLNKQVEHLSKLGSGECEDIDDPLRFKYMAEGARTVLNILENSSWGKQGTSNWLSLMDESQLEYALEEAKRMIKSKNEESRESVYVAICMQSSFITAIEKKANDWILSQFEKIATGKEKVTRSGKSNPFTDRDYSVRVERRKIRLSEINDMLDSNEVIPDEFLVDSESFRSYVAGKSKDYQDEMKKS